MSDNTENTNSEPAPETPRPDDASKGGKTNPPSQKKGPTRRPHSALFVLLAVAAMFYGMHLLNPDAPKLRDISESEFRGLVTSNRVDFLERVRERDSQSNYLLGHDKLQKAPPARRGGLLAASGKSEADHPIPNFKVQLVPGENEDLKKFLIEHEVPCSVREVSNVIGPLLRELLIIGLLIGATWFLFFRNLRGAGGPFNAGKSRAKLLTADKKKTTFKDVAGVDEAKEEVQEIIEFLKSPAKFKKLGGRIPKGVLLVGPPGTGKTLLARAIAGEANVPFFSISGSDFMEMFVGVGASRVRDMFEQGKRHAPCIIFIDEIDAIGQKRSRTGGYTGGGYSEQEQTLNAMLVEMDGFSANEGVIIVAATNRPDVLDPALLRPGRFDRQIVVDLPTLKGREDILALHSKNITFTKDADLKRIARGTPGFSGADLANLLNEAALLAARKSRDGVGHTELEEARDKVLWGRERRSAGYSRREREITAWHESGHALLQLLLENTDPLHKVTIIPRGRALGATMSLPNHDVLNRTRRQFLDELVMTTGGRIAEEFLTGDISTGAAQDIASATRLARNMVCLYGMTERFGFQSFSEPSAFTAEPTLPPFSQRTTEAIDDEVKAIVSAAYDKAKALLEANRDKLKLLADALLEKESMDGREIAQMLGIKDKSEDEDEDDGDNRNATGEAAGNVPNETAAGSADETSAAASPETSANPETSAQT